MEDSVINAAYVVSVLAMAVRDVLRLRFFLFGAQVLFLWWGTLIANTPTIVWNAVCLVINAVMIGRILWERRPIAVPDDLRDLFDEVFVGMRPRDFLLLWELGDPHRRSNTTLVRQGEAPGELQLVLSGQARVERDGEQCMIARDAVGVNHTQVDLLVGIVKRAGCQIECATVVRRA